MFDDRGRDRLHEIDTGIRVDFVRDLDSLAALEGIGRLNRKIAHHYVDKDLGGCVLRVVDKVLDTNGGAGRRSWNTPGDLRNPVLEVRADDRLGKGVCVQK